MFLTHMLNIVRILSLEIEMWNSPRSYRMVRNLSHAAQLWHGPRSSRTVKLNIEWFSEVLIYRDIYRL